MSREPRILQKRFAIFCEGDTEYNYIDTFDITIKSTDVDFDMLSKRCSNIEEFFDVIDW